jgi:hypothetical protein
MEEQEAPLDDVHDQIHEHAEHSRERWVMGVALSTALIAAVAAIASLLSGDNVNEAMLEQIKASNTWAHHQSDRIKGGELETRIELLKMQGKPFEKEQKKVSEYDQKRIELEEQARELEHSSEKRMERHHRIAKSVTWSQIAIAVSAIAVLTRQRWFWLAGLGFGVAGLFYLLWGALA